MEVVAEIRRHHPASDASAQGNDELARCLSIGLEIGDAGITQGAEGDGLLRAFDPCQVAILGEARGLVFQIQGRDLSQWQ